MFKLPYFCSLTIWSNHLIRIMDLSSDTEKKILEAARKVFETKGYNGTRMQKIADEAGISKASLHYYFRSKDNLFEKIFNDALDEYIPLVSTWADNDLSWEEKVEQFTKNMIEFIRHGRMLFLIREVNRNPQILEERIKRKAKSQNKFVVYFDTVQKSKSIRTVDPNYLYIILNSICSFPAINKEMFQRALRLNSKQYEALMDGYARAAADFFIHAIKKQ